MMPRFPLACNMVTSIGNLTILLGSKEPYTSMILKVIVNGYFI